MSESYLNASQGRFTLSKPNKVFSCQLCTRRKVKCDKRSPCSYCIKCGELCIQPDIQPTRHRKKRFAEAELLARLRRYEAALKNYGADIASINSGSVTDNIGTAATKSSSTASTLATPMGEEAESNWPSARDELLQEQDMMRGSDSDDMDETPITTTWDTLYHDDGSSLLLGPAPSEVDLISLHPDPVHVFSLWQAFIENVNPLMKIVHIPTLQPQILKASSNLKAITSAMHALMFGIYSMAVTSQNDEVCKETYGHDKSSMLRKFHMGSQCALRQAEMLRTSDITVLQALVLHLNSIRVQVDPRSLFCMSGLVERIARRNNLHRASHVKGMSVFDTEMRRRLWWQIVLLEARMAELSGCGPSSLSSLWDTIIPLNVNDSDLDPSMTVEPREHHGATEMIYCLPRYEIAGVLRQIRQSNGLNAGFHEFSTPRVNAVEMELAIDELERKIQEKYLKFCDVKIPMHHMAMGSVIYETKKMRYRMHGSRLHIVEGAALLEKERELVFELAVRMLENQVEMKQDVGLVKFGWYRDFNVPLHAFHVVINLRSRPTGELADRAWAAVSFTLQNHKNKRTMNSFVPPGMLDSPLQLAMANLVVKAWNVREQELRKQGTVVVPPYIDEMRQKLSTHRSSAATPVNPPQIENPSYQVDQADTVNFGNNTTAFDDQLPSLELENTMNPGFSDSFMSNDVGSWDIWDSFMPNSNFEGELSW